jgi:hypothetical protein
MFYGEPTLEDILSDPITLAVMRADGVDQFELRKTLGRLRALSAAWYYNRRDPARPAGSGSSSSACQDLCVQR